MLHPEPLPLWQATNDPYLLRRHSKQFCLSLCGVSGSWCAQGMFEPSEHLWRVWGLILNMILPLLLSCWGFSFALRCSTNNCTIVLISHAGKVMLKILQAKLQQYVNHEITGVQAGFRKGRGTRDQIANIRWIIKKESSRKTSISALLTMPSL